MPARDTSREYTAAIEHIKTLYMHMVTETYSWEPALLSDEMLNDDSKNSTLYDWGLSYVLVRK